MGRRWRLAQPFFSASEFISALKDAAWELPIPFLIIAGIYSGFCTATEAVVLTVGYVLLIKVVVFRELGVAGDIPRIMKESAKMVGGIMISSGPHLV